MNIVHNIMISGLLLICSQTFAANPVQDLIDQALLNGDPEVIIPAGTYEADDTLRLNNVHNFSVFAEGVTMVLTERRQTINLDNCSNLLIQGFTIDIDPLPFTQAIITDHASDWSWLEAQIDEGYPQDPSSSSKIEVFDGETGLLLPNVWTVYNADVEMLSSNTVRVSGSTTRYDNGVVTNGDKIVIGCPQINPHAVVIDDSTNCTFSNITLHASTTFGFLENRCHGNQYLGIKIIPGPSPVPGGEPRLRSLNADGIHSKQASLGPRIENCTIMCNGDDGVAINGDYDLILEASGNAVIIASKRDTEIQTGDTVRSFSTAGTLNFEAVVTAINPVSGYNTLRDQVVAGSGVKDPSLFQDTHQLTLSSSVSAVAGSAICALNRRGNGFVVRNNYIYNKRARGILIKADDGIIEGNTIEYNHMGSIVLAPELYWMEAGFSRSVRIINNRMNHCGLNPSHNGSNQAGTICVSADGDGGFAPAGGHRDIEISGNRIDNCFGANILATSISGLTIKNNVLMNTHVEVRNHGQNKGVNPDAAVSIINCMNVALDQNTIHNFGGETFLQADNVTSMTGENTFSNIPQSFMNFQILYEIGSASGDDDRDQMVNLVEYYLGRDPTAIDAEEPLARFMVNASNVALVAIGPRDGRNGVWVEVQRTATLVPADWTRVALRNGTNDWESPASLSAKPHSTDPNLEQVELLEPIGTGSPSAFYRLTLSTEPPLLESVTYSASADFSGVQGSNGWYYQEYDGSDFADMTWDGTNNRWQGSENYPRIFSNACHPGTDLDAVRKWVAPADGMITITGDVNRTSASGDGVVASIRKNAFILWTEILLPATATTPTGVEHISVSAGDAVYFMVNRGSTATSDYTAWNPTIEFSPYSN